MHSSSIYIFKDFNRFLDFLIPNTLHDKRDGFKINGTLYSRHYLCVATYDTMLFNTLFIMSYLDSVMASWVQNAAEYLLPVCEDNNNFGIST